MTNDTGESINFDNLGTEQLEKLKKCVKVISEYLGEQAKVRDSIKGTLDQLVADLKADKPSAKKAKKYVRTAARAYYSDSARAIREDNEAIERILKELGELV